MIFTSRHALHRQSGIFNKSIALSGLLAALLAAPVFADEVTDVTKLLRAGHYPEALSKADEFLNKRPRDAQARTRRIRVAHSVGGVDQRTSEFAVEESGKSVREVMVVEMQPRTDKAMAREKVVGAKDAGRVGRA